MLTLIHGEFRHDLPVCTLATAQIHIDDGLYPRYSRTCARVQPECCRYPPSVINTSSQRPPLHVNLSNVKPQRRCVLAASHTHTHPFNGPFSGTTRVSRYQKGKTNLDFTKTRDSEWQWHQLGHMQDCTSLQTDNHASTPPLSFLQAGCPSCRPTNSVTALKAKYCWPPQPENNRMTRWPTSTNLRRRLGTPNRHPTTTTTHYISKPSVVWLWFRCGVPGLWTKVDIVCHHR